MIVEKTTIAPCYLHVHACVIYMYCLHLGGFTASSVAMSYPDIGAVVSAETKAMSIQWWI